MDEEDLAEMRSEEKLETKGGFGVENASGSRKRKGPEAASVDIPYFPLISTLTSI